MKKIIKISTVPYSLNMFLENQLKMLSEYYEIVAVSSPGEDLNIVRDRENVRIVAIPMERHISLFKDFISLFRLIKLFHKEKPDIVHSLTPKAGLLSMLAAFITCVPVRIHTFTGLIFPSKSGFMKKILIFMDKIICNCATYINPEGEGVKKELKKITSNPLHIIANGNVRGVNLDQYKITEPLTQQAKNIFEKANNFIFLFVGRIVKDKGINEILNAFNKLSQKYENIKLFLVGEFEEKLDPISKNSLKIIENNSNVICFGRQGDVRPYFVISDLFVFPSYREGFPNVVLEAGAMELPSIVTDISGSNEIVKNRENGFIIPIKNTEVLYEKMEYLYLNRNILQEMQKNCRKNIVEKYDQKLIWEELLKTYNNLLENIKSVN